jgi:EAL domain-containing protein (putative c-di-GMP-specific phosphodiesterase class I)
MNVEIVAEGVESLYHLDRLREIGCECGQGFYFAKPLDPQTAQEFLFKKPSW